MFPPFTLLAGALGALVTAPFWLKIGPTPAETAANFTGGLGMAIVGAVYLAGGFTLAGAAASAGAVLLTAALFAKVGMDQRFEQRTRKGAKLKKKRSSLTEEIERGLQALEKGRN